MSFTKHISITILPNWTTRSLVNIKRNLPVTQCLIFSTSFSRIVSLCAPLLFAAFRSFRCRFLPRDMISTTFARFSFHPGTSRPPLLHDTILVSSRYDATSHPSRHDAHFPFSYDTTTGCCHRRQRGLRRHTHNYAHYHARIARNFVRLFVLPLAAGRRVGPWGCHFDYRSDRALLVLQVHSIVIHIHTPGAGAGNAFAYAGAQIVLIPTCAPSRLSG